MANKYRITARNIIAHEIIGLKAKVVESTDPNKVDIEGIIVDETKNTLKLKTKKGLKILPKKEVVLEIELPEGGKVLLDMSKLTLRPEDRTKAFWRRII